MTEYNERIQRIKGSLGKYTGNEIDYVLAALDTEDPDFKKTTFVARFERAFADRFNKRYAVSCNSATSGLHTALAAAGVGPGDEVISPALNVIMGAYATVHLAGIPVFADVNSGTHNIDPKDVEQKITPKTKAIIAVAWNGMPVDIDPLVALARKHDIVLIEDVAQDMLGRNDGRISGTVGDIGVWSFNYKKHMSGATEGGIMCTDDEQLAIRLRKFAGIGYHTLTAVNGSTSLAHPDFQNPDFERFDTIGLNYRMSEITAAVLLGQLERIDELVARRRECGRLFNEAVAGHDWMGPQKVPAGIEHSYYTVAMVYEGAERFGVPWKRFYDRYAELGGDGFYAELQCPYNEPSLRGRDFGRGKLGRELCSVAESLQPKIMKFKSNYRDLEVACKKAEILRRVVEEVAAGDLAV